MLVMAAKWEEGFRAAVKTGRQGWTVGNNSGKVRLKIRAKDLRTDSANLHSPGLLKPSEMHCY